MDMIPPGFRRVLSVDGRRVPMRAADGTLHMERFIGYKPDGSRSPDPVDVPDSPAVWAALDAGDLIEYVPPKAPGKKTSTENGGA